MFNQEKKTKENDEKQLNAQAKTEHIKEPAEIDCETKESSSEEPLASSKDGPKQQGQKPLDKTTKTGNDARKPLIEIKHVRKVYRMGEERIVALDDISLNIYKGEIVCFLGKSGSGKSTFLNMVAGLEKPTKGEIIIGNVPLHKLNEEQITMFRQKNIGFIFQAYNLLPMLTALENVEYPLVLRGMDRKRREKRARIALREVGLVGYEKRKPNQMSGGQQQRVGIARAIAVDPKIIFADEPTGNLDSKTTAAVMNLIVDRVHKNQQTMILVTHDNTIALYADRIVTVQDGNIIRVQTKEEFDPSVDISQQGDGIPLEIEEMDT